MSKKDDPSYILNPVTDKYVLRTGAIGKKILKGLSEKSDDIIVNKLDSLSINDKPKNLTVDFGSDPGPEQDSLKESDPELSGHEIKRQKFFERCKNPDPIVEDSIKKNFVEDTSIKGSLWGLQYNSQEELDVILKNPEIIEKNNNWDRNNNIRKRQNLSSIHLFLYDKNGFPAKKIFCKFDKDGIPFRSNKESHGSSTIEEL
jgi:hypothetical protein